MSPINGRFVWEIRSDDVGVVIVVQDYPRWQEPATIRLRLVLEYTIDVLDRRFALVHE